MGDVSVRVGDAERRDVDARLQQAVGDGRLTLQEYDERAGQVWAARTRAELDATVHDLPAVTVPTGAPVPVRGRRSRPRRAIAVMSGDRLTGPLEPGQGVEAYAVMGGAVVDLRGEGLPGHVNVRAVAVMGGIEVLVPRGATVHLSGVAFMGGRDVTVDPPQAGGHVVDVQAWALMGGIEVKHGDAPDAPVSLSKDRPGTGFLDSGHGVSGLSGHGSAVDRSQRHRAERHRGRPGRRVSWRRIVIGVAVVAAAYGATAVVESDSASVFSSGVTHVRDGETRSIGTLFGSETVVVPDGAQVDSSGTILFGSLTCDACASGSPTGPVVHISGRGAFGSVDVVTESAWKADHPGNGN